MYAFDAGLTEQELASDLANLLNIDAEEGVITFAVIGVDLVSWKTSYSIEEPDRMDSTKVTFPKIIATFGEDIEREY